MVKLWATVVDEEGDKIVLISQIKAMSLFISRQNPEVFQFYVEKIADEC